MKLQKYIIVAVTILIILLTVVICLVIKDNANPLQSRIDEGYEYLNEGNYGKAIVSFEKALKYDSDNIFALIGKSTVQIKKKNTSGAVKAVQKTIDAALNAEEIDDLQMKQISTLVKWWIKNTDVNNNSFDEYFSKINNLDIEDEYDFEYFGFEDEEPYREYELLYINSTATSIRRYTGNNAEITWENEGYESDPPYREYEMKYINGEKTDEKRYTGNTKPQDYDVYYDTCPICNYPAGAPPAEHPGHGLEEYNGMYRKQFSDGSWKFVVY